MEVVRAPYLHKLIQPLTTFADCSGCPSSLEQIVGPQPATSILDIRGFVS
jgi:hypothetical protein